jgi:hypothetical protein
VAAPVSRPAGLTEEQQERMRRNKEMAALKKREREAREAEEILRDEEQGDLEEIEREMLTGQNASEWSTEADKAKSEVEASCLRTVEELHKKKNRKQVFDSDSEEEMLVKSPKDDTNQCEGTVEDETNQVKGATQAVISQVEDEEISLDQIMEEMEN